MANYDYYKLKVNGSFYHKVKFISDLFKKHEEYWEQDIYTYFDYVGLKGGPEEEHVLFIHFDFKYVTAPDFDTWLTDYCKSNDLTISGTFFSESVSDSAAKVTYP